MERLSTSCGDIMIYNFDKISETNDFRYMVIAWDGFSEIEFDAEQAEENWHKIYNEYAVLSDDNKTILYYRTLIELNNLKAVHYVVGEIIKLLPTVRTEKSMNEFFNELDQYKFITNKKLSFSDRINQAKGLLKFHTNKIDLLQNVFDNLKGVEQRVPLMKQVVRLERALKRDLIDPKTTTVEKWQYLIDEIKSVA